jgi:hypothetical protein
MEEEEAIQGLQELGIGSRHQDLLTLSFGRALANERRVIALLPIHFSPTLGISVIEITAQRCAFVDDLLAAQVSITRNLVQEIVTYSREEVHKIANQFFNDLIGPPALAHIKALLAEYNDNNEGLTSAASSKASLLSHILKSGSFRAPDIRASGGFRVLDIRGSRRPRRPRRLIPIFSNSRRASSSIMPLSLLSTKSSLEKRLETGRRYIGATGASSTGSSRPRVSITSNVKLVIVHSISLCVAAGWSRTRCAIVVKACHISIYIKVSPGGAHLT